jgi:hypothetical protein
MARQGLFQKAGKGLCLKAQLIQRSVIYCLILISDSIMVPCDGRITLIPKGSVNSCFIVNKNKKEIFLTIQKSLGKAI